MLCYHVVPTFLNFTFRILVFQIIAYWLGPSLLLNLFPIMFLHCVIQWEKFHSLLSGLPCPTLCCVSITFGAQLVILSSPSFMTPRLLIFLIVLLEVASFVWDTDLPISGSTLNAGSQSARFVALNVNVYPFLPLPQLPMLSLGRRSVFSLTASFWGVNFSLSGRSRCVMR